MQQQKIGFVEMPTEFFYILGIIKISRFDSGFY